MDPKMPNMEIVMDDGFLAGPERYEEEQKSGEANAMFYTIASGFLLPLFSILSTSIVLKFLGFSLWNFVDFLLFIFYLLMTLILYALFLLYILNVPDVYQAFYAWRSQNKDHFCPRCQFHLPTHLAYRCSRCNTVNSSDNLHCYFLTCKNCHQPHDGILCLRCKRTIALTNDRPIRCIAIPTEKHPEPVKKS